MSNTCPCCSQKVYEQCCQPYIESRAIAETPEALMRSRYTAYTQANVDYIKATMCGPAAVNYDALAARQWAEQAEWLNLSIRHTSTMTQDDTIGFVEFIAKYHLNGKKQKIHERSEFQLIKGRWYYFRGKSLK